MWIKKFKNVQNYKKKFAKKKVFSTFQKKDMGFESLIYFLNIDKKFRKFFESRKNTSVSFGG